MYGNIHTLKHHPSQLICTTSQIITDAVLHIQVDGVIYLIKKRFNPAEQMIVAYHKGTIVYAYKGIFNYNIDHDWTGGIINNFTKIIDDCPYNKNIHPAPSAASGDVKLLGLAFDKTSPCAHQSNCDTITGSFNRPSDC